MADVVFQMIGRAAEFYNLLSLVNKFVGFEALGSADVVVVVASSFAAS